jgi:hypothetical protein
VNPQKAPVILEVITQDHMTACICKAKWITLAIKSGSKTSITITENKDNLETTIKTLWKVKVMITNLKSTKTYWEKWKNKLENEVWLN